MTAVYRYPPLVTSNKKVYGQIVNITLNRHPIEYKLIDKPFKGIFLRLFNFCKSNIWLYISNCNFQEFCKSKFSTFRAKYSFVPVRECLDQCI